MNKMSKIKNKDEFKERDEIEEYFGEVKNRSFPTGIIFVFILLLIIGGLSYYYFIIDSPKNIFLTLLNNNLKTNYISYEKINYEFNLDTNIETTNKKYLDTINIINNIAITGIGGADSNINKSYNKLNTFYKGEELLTLNTYSEFDKNIYLKSDELFDKVIKVSLNNQTTEENKNNKDYNLDTDNLEVLYNSLIDILKPLLNNANYEKEYTNLNDTLVKKITLLIDKSFKKDFYNSLLDNNDFLDSFSKIEGITKKELENTLTKEINNLDDDVEKISLCVSILENKFISLEIISDDNRVTIYKEDNTYNYKIYDDEIIEYLGYIEVTKTNNDYEISLSYEDIEKDLNIKLNLDLSLDYNKDIETMDIKNAIDYKSLTETDINKITTNINKNNNLTNLIMDIQTISKNHED